MGMNDLPSFDYGTLREIGVGLARNPNSGGQPLSWYITQDFGVVYDMSSGSFAPTIIPFLVGVVYTDLDSDGFYTPGEGAGGITVMPDVGDDFAVTSTSGGYAFPLKNLPPGTTSITLTFSGGPLGSRQIVRTVALNGTQEHQGGRRPRGRFRDTPDQHFHARALRDRRQRGHRRIHRLRHHAEAGSAARGRAFARAVRGDRHDVESDAASFRFQRQPESIAANDDWQTQPDGGAAVLATGQQPCDSRESAVVLTLAPGSYTAIVSGVGGEMGVGRVDAIDLDPASSASSVINLSTRGHVLTDPADMIGGFVISGTHQRRVIIRAIGPSLAAFGVPGTLRNHHLPGLQFGRQHDRHEHRLADRPVDGGIADAQPRARAARMNPPSS